MRIDSVAFGGDGVGRLRDEVVFVPFTVDGDEAVVKIVETRKRFARGCLEQIISPSPHRAEPSCRHYAYCGGCQYQHIRYEHQLRIKARQVADAFVRIGKVDSPPVAPVTPSPEPFHYRGKADYHLLLSPEEPVVLGFMDILGGRIVDIERCEIVDETINRACLAFRQDLAAGRIAAPPDRQTIWSADADGENVEVVTDFRVPRFINRTVKGKPLRVPYRGFFQANGVLLPCLVDHVLEVSALTGGETVADIFCGSGLFSFFLAPHARHIYGIEKDGEAVHCARWNHSRAGLANAVFYRGDAGKMLQKALAAGKRNVDVLILDPPRTGCEPALISSVIDLNPAKIIYISCDPATQARDIRCLADHGFTLKILQPFDMFPQTAHIEVVALLER